MRKYSYSSDFEHYKTSDKNVGFLRLNLDK
jgi:hypothetical protein